MVEIYYALTKMLNPEVLLYTIISTAIIDNAVVINNNKISISKNYLPNEITPYFKKIKLKKKNYFTNDDLNLIIKSLTKDKTRKKYLTHIPFFGYVTKKFPSKNIRMEFANANIKIIDFINTGDIKALNEINQIIGSIKFGINILERFNSFYKDSADAHNTTMSLRLGISNTEKYKKYYTNRGNQREIE